MVPLKRIIHFAALRLKRSMFISIPHNSLRKFVTACDSLWQFLTACVSTETNHQFCFISQSFIIIDWTRKRRRWECSNGRNWPISPTEKFIFGSITIQANLEIHQTSVHSPKVVGLVQQPLLALWLRRNHFGFTLRGHRIFTFSCSSFSTFDFCGQQNSQNWTVMMIWRKNKNSIFYNLKKSNAFIHSLWK